MNDCLREGRWDGRNIRNISKTDLEKLYAILNERTNSLHG